MAGRVTQAIIIRKFAGLAFLIMAVLLLYTATPQGAPALAPTKTRTPTRFPTRTRTPAQAVRRTATPTRAAGFIRISGGGFNRVPPGQIIEEMGITFGGGGPPGPVLNDTCINGSAVPRIAQDRGARELMMPVYFHTCGWQPGEPVKITVRDPLGKVQTRSVAAGKTYSFNEARDVWLYYQAPYTAPAGKYTFTFQGRATRIETSETYLKPGGPRLYVLSPDPFQPVLQPYGNRHSLLLFQFAAGEKIRLVAYRGSEVTFYGYRDTTAGPDGSLRIEVNLSGVAEDVPFTYFAFGAKGGKVIMLPGDDVMRRDAYLETDNYCPGADPTRLGLGDYTIRSAYAGGKKLSIYLQPDFASNFIQQVEPGALLTRSLPVKCVNGVFWWGIQVEIGGDRLEGWVPETYQGQYLIEPTNVEPLCPGAKTSPLDQGEMRMRAAYAGGQKLTVFAGPGPFTQVVTQVEEGEILDRTMAVKCVLGERWWQVRLSGYPVDEGWVAETEQGRYRVEPIDVEPQCPGAQPSPLKQGDYEIRAAYVDGSGLDIHAGPDFSSQVVDRAEEGEVLRHTYAVRCVKGTRWWQVYTPNNALKRGWLAEMEQGQYTVGPVDAQPVCPGAKISRLAGREKARAARIDGTILRIRQKPSFTSPVLAQVAEGEELDLTGSFRCVAGTIWWETYLWETHQYAWVAEVYQGKYILEPPE